MSSSSITLTAGCDGIIHATVTIHDVPAGATWQVVEVWGADFYPSSGNDHQASYHAQGTPGATYRVGANVLINGVHHDADAQQVTIPRACEVTTTTSTTLAPTTTTVTPTTVVTVGPTTTTIRLDTAITTTTSSTVAQTTTTAQVGTATSVVRPASEELPATGVATWGIGVAALILVVFGSLFRWVGR